MSSSSGVFRFVFGATVFRLAIFCALIVATFCCHGSVPPRRRSPTVTPTTDAPGGNTTDKPAGPEGATFSFKANPPLTWTYFATPVAEQQMAEKDAKDEITKDIQTAVDAAKGKDFKEAITVVLDDTVKIITGKVLGGCANDNNSATNTITSTCDGKSTTATPLDAVVFTGQLKTTEVVDDAVWTAFGDKLQTELEKNAALKIADGSTVEVKKA